MDEQTPDSDDAKVFVSYSRRDREKAQRISDVLRERHFGVFLDTDDILPTEEWKGRLEQLIAEADTIVFLLSPNSAVSEVCAWEVEHASALGKRIAPMMIEEVDTALIPPLLARLNFIFATDRDPFENAVSTLVSALNSDIEWIREHTRLGGLAMRWDRAGRGGHLLLRGQDIADAEMWRDTHPADAPAVTGLQAEFITQSRRAAARRQRMVAVGSVIGLVAAVALSVFAWFQSVEAGRARAAAEDQLRAAQINESRFLARRSVELTEMGDFTAAAQVALMALPGEGGSRPLAPAAESALRHALSNLTEIAYLPPLSDHQRTEAAISDNGRYAAQSNGGDRIVVTDLRTMEVVIDREAPSWWTNFAFTPDGRLLRVSRRKSFRSNEGTDYELWDVEKGERLADYETPIIALSPDGRTAVSVLGESYNYRIVLTDPVTGDEKGVLAEEVQAIREFSFDATGEWLLMRGRVRVEDTTGWYVANLTTGKIRQLNPENPMIFGEARWASDGTTLLATHTVNEVSTFRMWDAPYDGTPKVLTPEVKGFGNNASVSPDGRYIDMILNDAQVILDAETGATVRRFTEQRQIRMLPGSETFAMYGGSLTGIEFHRLSPPGLLARISTLGYAPSRMVVTGDSRRLITQGWDASIQIWEIPEFVSRPVSLANQLDSQVRGIEFAPDGETLIAHSQGYQTLLVADVSDPPRDGRGTYLGGGRGLPTRFYLNKLPPGGRCPKERYLDVVTKVRGVDRPADGEDQGWACAVATAVSPDGGMIIRLHSRNDKRGVELQSTTGAFETAFLPVDTFAMTLIRFSPDGRFAMITPDRFAGNGGLVLIDLERRALVELKGIDDTRGTGTSVITSDNARLIVPSQTALKIWSVETGRVIGEVVAEPLDIDPVTGLQSSISHLFSDDRRLLISSRDTARIIDYETGEVLVDNVTQLYGTYAVSPDERLVAVGSYGDQSVRIWDIERGVFVARLAGFVTSETSGENGITSLAFSPDNTLLAAGSVNGQVRVWSVPQDFSGLIADTRERLPRWADANDLNLFGD